MGSACSLGAVEGKAGKGLVKKRFRTVPSFGKKKKKVAADDDSCDRPKSVDSADNRLSSFSSRSSTSTPRKSGEGSKRSSFFGKVGLEKAVEVLDAFGSGVVNLNSVTFMSGLTGKGNKISVLAFEVASTITRGAAILHSLSEENVRRVKEEVLCSEGVQRLVSSDAKLLLSFIAEDKREEIRVFMQEVVRFGDRCKDPQWHNLDRYFATLRNELAVIKPCMEDADLKMRELLLLAQHTSELYHELNALDRFEHDYRNSCEEAQSMNISCTGESLAMLQTELRHQRRQVWSLKKKSLWSKRLEEIVEKLVDVNVFVHLKIMEAFGSTDVEGAEKEADGHSERLGVAGLALHYANIINQIDNIASRPTCLPTNARDSLYRGLPPNVKVALRTSLRRYDDTKEDITVQQIKAEMERILEWLAPMAASTSKMYQGFGWVGEWANTSHDFTKQSVEHEKPIRLQTLYHADKKRTESYILELLQWLHLLIKKIKRRDIYEEIRKKQPPILFQTGSQNGSLTTSVMTRFPFHNSNGKTQRLELTMEERDLIEKVSKKQFLPLASKSQEFRRGRLRSFKTRKSSQSTTSSPHLESSWREVVVEPLDGRDIEGLDWSGI